MSGSVWERTRCLKLLFSLMLIFLFMWILLITFISSDSHLKPPRPSAQKKSEQKAPPAPPAQKKIEKKDPPIPPAQKKREQKEPPAPPAQKKSEQKPPPAPPAQKKIEKKDPLTPPAQKKSEQKPPPAQPAQKKSEQKPPPAPPAQKKIEKKDPLTPPAQKKSEQKPPPAQPAQKKSEQKPPPAPPAQKKSEQKPPPAPPAQKKTEKKDPSTPPAQKKSEKKPPPAPPAQEKSEKKAPPAPPAQEKSEKKAPPAPPAQKKIEKKDPPAPPDICNGCRTIIDKVLKQYSQPWKKQEVNYQQLRSQLETKCNGKDKAIMTQANTPVESKIAYDGERNRVYKVNSGLFSSFVKDSPFSNKTWNTCAVVGNGGILTNSSCGNAIDSAQFVIRCNLPPLENEFKIHVGSKTDIVTANPSILQEKYGSLSGHRRPFVESLHKYGNSMLLLPAFSFGTNTPVSLRALYTIEDFGMPIQPVFFNPEYLLSLMSFWRTQGLNAIRPSTGLMVVSLALEICTNVHLYGFWPFSNHPHGFQPLTNHYFDNKPPKKGIHAMPVEFNLLLQLHSQGVLKVHLGQCGKR